jgi:hypothetical protein
MRLLGLCFFCKAAWERRSNREAERVVGLERTIGRDGSAPAVQVPECAPGEIISATIFTGQWQINTTGTEAARPKESQPICHPRSGESE